MAMKLTKNEHNRLSALNAGRGQRRGADVFTAKPCKYKITPKQVVIIKERLDLGMTYKEVLCDSRLYNLSTYHVKQTKRGDYDHLLE